MPFLFLAIMAAMIFSENHSKSRCSVWAMFSYHEGMYKQLHAKLLEAFKLLSP